MRRDAQNSDHSNEPADPTNATGHGMAVSWTLWASPRFAPTRRLVLSVPAIGASRLALAVAVAVAVAGERATTAASRAEWHHLVGLLGQQDAAVPTTSLRHRLGGDRVGLRAITHRASVASSTPLSPLVITLDPRAGLVDPDAHLASVAHTVAAWPWAWRRSATEALMLASVQPGPAEAVAVAVVDAITGVDDEAWARGVLGVDAHASPAVIRARYRALVRAVHPDRGHPPEVAAVALAAAGRAKAILLAPFS